MINDKFIRLANIIRDASWDNHYSTVANWWRQNYYSDVTKTDNYYALDIAHVILKFVVEYGFIDDIPSFIILLNMTFSTEYGFSDLSYIENNKFYTKLIFKCVEVIRLSSDYKFH